MNYRSSETIDFGYTYTSTVDRTVVGGNFVNYRWNGTSISKVSPRQKYGGGFGYFQFGGQSVAGGWIGSGVLPDGSPGAIYTPGPSGVPFGYDSTVTIYYGLEIGINPSYTGPENYAIIHPLGSVTLPYYPPVGSRIITTTSCNFTVRIRLYGYRGYADDQEQTSLTAIWPEAGECYQEINVGGVYYRRNFVYTPGTTMFPNLQFGSQDMQAACCGTLADFPVWPDASTVCTTSPGFVGAGSLSRSPSVVTANSINAGGTSAGRYSIDCEHIGTYIPTTNIGIAAENRTIPTNGVTSKAMRLTVGGVSQDHTGETHTYTRTFGGVNVTRRISHYGSSSHGTSTGNTNTMVLPSGSYPYPLLMNVGVLPGEPEDATLAYFHQLAPSYPCLEFTQAETVNLITPNSMVVLTDDPNDTPGTPGAALEVSTGSPNWDAGEVWQIGYRYLEFRLTSTGTSSVKIEGKLVGGTAVDRTVTVTSADTSIEELDLLSIVQSGLGEWLSLTDVKVTHLSGDPATVTHVYLKRKVNSRLTILSDSRWDDAGSPNPTYGDYANKGDNFTHDWTLLKGTTDGVSSLKVLHRDALGYTHVYSLRNLARHINNQSFHTYTGGFDNYGGSARSYYPRTWGWSVSDLTSPGSKTWTGHIYYPVEWFTDSDVRIVALHGEGFAGQSLHINQVCDSGVAVVAQRTTDRLNVPFAIAIARGGTFTFYGLWQGTVLGSIVDSTGSALTVHETTIDGLPVDNPLTPLSRETDSSALGPGMFGDPNSNSKGGLAVVNTIENGGGTPTSFALSPEMRQLVFKRFWPDPDEVNLKDLEFLYDGTQRLFLACIDTEDVLKLKRLYQYESGIIGEVLHIGSLKTTTVYSGTYQSLSLFAISGNWESPNIGEYRYGAGVYGLVSIELGESPEVKLFISTNHGEAWRVETIPGTYTNQKTCEHRGRLIFMGWRSDNWYVRVGAARVYTGVAGAGDYAWSTPEVSVVATTKSAGDLWVREDGTICFSYLTSAGDPKLIQCEAISNAGVGTWV